MKTKDEKLQNNQIEEMTAKIKNDLLEILGKKRGGSCLCGHRESCDVCSPSPRYTGLVRDLNNYINNM